MLSGNSMRKSFKDSLKVLEADIQHANSLYVVLLSSQFFFFASFLGLISFVLGQSGFLISSLVVYFFWVFVPDCFDDAHIVCC